jgi:hypothetical protein
MFLDVGGLIGLVKLASRTRVYHVGEANSGSPETMST